MFDSLGKIANQQNNIFLFLECKVGGFDLQMQWDHQNADEINSTHPALWAVLVPKREKQGKNWLIQTSLLHFFLLLKYFTVIVIL